eukprot:TRINITY_DN328_c0_g2_i6.p2 TRINITY_DN328_c0_g2~~TRINITY_DN328_c0_g2_i6.p2  ORF type:complete len:275 (+),score=89.81 TRINITY_DN328_c0_g2_i6:217-1041(+)
MHGAFVPAAAARLSTRVSTSAAAAAAPASTASSFLSSLRPRRARAAAATPRVRTAHGTVPAMGLFDAIKSAGASMLSQAEPMQVPDKHRVLGTPLKDDGTWASKGYGTAYFAGGCFWGVEKLFWTTPGVVSTAVGYQGGEVENPTYRGVCTGGTGHTEVVKVVYDPVATSYTKLLNVFWSSHDPTTANRQGNDVGTQYRSAIFYTTPEQKAEAERTMAHFNECAKGKRNGATTEIKDAEKEPFYFAEAYHQQYLDANPGGYCPSHGTGLYIPVE